MAHPAGILPVFKTIRDQKYRYSTLDGVLVDL